MDHLIFTDAIVEQLTKSNKEIEILKYWNNEKSYIKNYPLENINIEVKPFSTGIFVLNLMNFESFSFDLLCGKLSHKRANFILTSRCIYIYPTDTEDLDLCLELLGYTTGRIMDIYSQMKHLS